MSLPTQFFRRARLSCAFVFLAVVANACGDDTEVASTPATETYASALGVNIAAMQTKAENLYYQDVIVGTGTEAIAGKAVSVIYTGWLADGTQFDSNVGGAPFVVSPLGQANVIKGWNLGLQGARVGGKRRLVIGSGLAYGAEGSSPSIGKNKTLIFDITIVAVN
ncbi:MAG: FKBP-type peptidyl-prolyl cis-trans isomerase [Gemmatimonadaceae bacterium]